MATAELEGKKVAFLTAQEGVEEVELTEPWKAVTDAGATAELIAPEDGEVQTFNHLDKSSTYRVDQKIADADPGDYDALVLPGGVANPDQLRTDEHAIRFVQGVFSAGKPVGVICHGPWTLVEADLVRGRELTSWPSLQTDIRNAGGNGSIGRSSSTRDSSRAASPTTYPRSAPRSSRSSRRVATRPPTPARPAARGPRPRSADVGFQPAAETVGCGPPVGSQLRRRLGQLSQLRQALLQQPGDLHL